MGHLMAPVWRGSLQPRSRQKSQRHVIQTLRNPIVLIYRSHKAMPSLKPLWSVRVLGDSGVPRLPRAPGSLSSLLGVKRTTGRASLEPGSVPCLHSTMCPLGQWHTRGSSHFPLWRTTPPWRTPSPRRAHYPMEHIRPLWSTSHCCGVHTTPVDYTPPLWRAPQHCGAHPTPMEHNPLLWSTSPCYGLWHELFWGEAGGPWR